MQNRACGGFSRRHVGQFTAADYRGLGSIVKAARGQLTQARDRCRELAGDEEMPLVRRCGAPKAWASDETCGTLFARRANQMY
jgi:hypothetical protein